MIIGCIILANALKTNTTASVLDLRGNSIRSEGAIALGQMLKVNGALKKYIIYNLIVRLLLEWNCIGIWDDGVSNLSEALTLNMTLEELDLRNNKIGPHGVQILAASIRHNTSLRRIGKKCQLISRFTMEYCGTYRFKSFSRYS